MLKLWSFSTTLRSPDRIVDFLEVINSLEGQEWNRENQEKFQVLLIQHRKYVPEKKGLSEDSISILENAEIKMTYEQARKIFDEKNYQDPPMRGRTSFAPLKELGLAYINDENKICISKVAKQIIDKTIDFSDFFLKWAMKWQYPNPTSNDYIEGYNIKPLIGTIKLILEVNKVWESMGHEPVGISKNEFSIFALSLTNIENLDTQVNKLIDYRKKLSTIPERDKQNYYKEYILENLNEFTNATLNNIRDYTDNVIRYFLLTSLLKKRGNGFYIDIVPSRMNYIEKLLNIIDGSSDNYLSKQEYLKYLSDMNVPMIELDSEELREAYKNEIIDLINSNNIYTEHLIKLKEYDLKQLVNLRKRILFKLEKELYYNQDGLTEIIKKLENVRNLDVKPSLALERWISTALIVLNDAKEICPNYSSDDDNNIIFTAPSGKPDIECFYENFNSICEVTMLTGRDQWHNEGQPVMRHLCDFIKNNSLDNKNTYCLFIAPQIHRDTLNTFWYSVKYEYEGLKLKIIPLSLRRFEEIIYALRRLESSQKKFTRNNLKELFDLVCDIEKLNNSTEWWQHVNNSFEQWKEKLLENV